MNITNSKTVYSRGVKPEPTWQSNPIVDSIDIVPTLFTNPIDQHNYIPDVEGAINTSGQTQTIAKSGSESVIMNEQKPKSTSHGINSRKLNEGTLTRVNATLKTPIGYTLPYAAEITDVPRIKPNIVKKNPNSTSHKLPRLIKPEPTISLLEKVKS